LFIFSQEEMYNEKGYAGGFKKEDYLLDEESDDDLY
jgi:hypothetical protein